MTRSSWLSVGTRIRAAKARMATEFPCRTSNVVASGGCFSQLAPAGNFLPSGTSRALFLGRYKRASDSQGSLAEVLQFVEKTCDRLLFPDFCTALTNQETMITSNYADGNTEFGNTRIKNYSLSLNNNKTENRITKQNRNKTTHPHRAPRRRCSASDFSFLPTQSSKITLTFCDSGFEVEEFAVSMAPSHLS